MGVLSNTKQFLEKKAAEVAQRTAEGVAATSALSPSQLQQVDKKRTAYLTEKPNMADDDIQDLIKKNLGAVGIEVYQAYLEQLKTAYRPMDAALENLDALNRIRYFEITKWVTDPTEKNLDKLVNVYQVLSEENCNIALIYHRTQKTCKVTMAVVNTDMDQADPALADTLNARLSSAVKGNFPGGGNSRKQRWGAKALEKGSQNA
jgi:hypothetical protein